MIVNLTPHVLSLYNEVNMLVASIPPSGTVARVSASREKVSEQDGIPFFRATYGEVTGLPDPAPDTIYVVSGMVRAAVQRSDLWQPGEALRNEAGAVIGAVGLSQ